MAEVYRIVGKWLGSGTVVTRNIPYSEEISIVPFGTPNGAVYNFTSKTWAPQGDYDTTPMHTETGILKWKALESGDCLVELMLSHPFGLTEIQAGDAKVMRLRSKVKLFQEHLQTPT